MFIDFGCILKFCMVSKFLTWKAEYLLNSEAKVLVGIRGLSGELFFPLSFL